MAGTRGLHNIGFGWALFLLAVGAVVAAGNHDGESARDAFVSRTEEEAEVSKAANAGISVMLLGSISFMMGLFYLVHHHDKDMVKYCWQVISSTISIFSAVLLFQAVNGVVESLLLEDASKGVELLVGMLHFVVWFFFLQVVVAHFAGTMSGKAERTKEDWDRMERRMKCYAILLGHITGFAGINAFGLVQHMVPRDALPIFFVAPASWTMVYILGQLMDLIRDTVARTDDGEVDRAEELWDEVAEETEDDIIGLTVSFLLVQTLRLLITGLLPSAEGEESEEQLSSHPFMESVALFFVGVILVMVEFLRTIYIKYKFRRLTAQVRNVTMMCFAWCFFFSTDWILCRFVFLSEHGMIKEVSLALLITAVSMSTIFLLDKLADMPATDDQIDHAIRSVVRALGILIGFSWEKAFDQAVDSVSRVTESVVPEQVSKLILAIALSALVVPAWRHFILPTIIAYEREEEDEEEEHEAEEKNGKDTETGAGGESTLSEPLLAENTKNQLSQRLPSLSAVGNSRRAARVPQANATQRAIVESDTGDLGRRCEQYEKHIATLEARNFTLETSLSDFVAELSELQKLAEVLRKSPAPP